MGTGNSAPPPRTTGVVRAGVTQLWSTVEDLRQLPRTRRFLAVAGLPIFFAISVILLTRVRLREGIMAAESRLPDQSDLAESDQPL